jgi:hypothetical protein
MKSSEFITEAVQIDNKDGWGAVPFNQEIGYLGLRVKMTPGMFLQLAAPLGDPTSMDDIKQHISSGGTLGAPFLNIQYPYEWHDGDFSEKAKVVGHEGRNRMNAIQQVYNNDPVEVHLFFNQGVRNRDLTPEIIKNLNRCLIPEKQSNPQSWGPYFRVMQS